MVPAEPSPHSSLVEGLSGFNLLYKESESLLQGLSQQLSSLEAATAPISSRALKLIWAESNISRTKEALDELLAFLDTSHRVEAPLKSGPQRDLDSYLKHVAALDAAIQYLDSHSSMLAAQEAYGHAEMVHSKAMRDCQADFGATLTQQSSATMPSASLLIRQATDNLHVAALEPQLDPISGVPLDRLRRLARVMYAAGHVSCLDTYQEIRSRSIEAVMRLVGFEPSLSLATLQVQSQDQLEKTVSGWTLQLRVLAVVAASELDLAKSIWPSPVDEAVFSGSLSRVLRLLVQQGTDVAGLNRGGAARVFILLEMNRHLKEVLPLLDELLGRIDRFGQFLSELGSLYALLARAARGVFAEFEASVGRDNSKAQTVDGTVHPQCAATLSYLRRLFSYSNVGILFRGGQRTSRGGGPDSEAEASEGPGSAASASMGAAVGRVLSSLTASLEVKSKAYKSPALGALFMMNNVHYMVSTVQKSEDGLLLGPRWLQQHKQVVEQYRQQYHSLTWQPLIEPLERVLEGHDSPPTENLKWREWLKARWRSFNSGFEAVYAAQTGWTIPDAKLKASVREAVRQSLLPAYEAFYEEYASAEFSVNPSKYVRYSPSDVQAFISNDLYEGQQMDLAKVLKAAKGGLLALGASTPSGAGAGGRSVAGSAAGTVTSSMRRAA